MIPGLTLLREIGPFRLGEPVFKLAKKIFGLIKRETEFQHILCLPAPFSKNEKIKPL